MNNRESSAQRPSIRQSGRAIILAGALALLLSSTPSRATGATEAAACRDSAELITAGGQVVAATLIATHTKEGVHVRIGTEFYPEFGYPGGQTLLSAGIAMEEGRSVTYTGSDPENTAAEISYDGAPYSVVTWNTIDGRLARTAEWDVSGKGEITARVRHNDPQIPTSSDKIPSGNYVELKCTPEDAQNQFSSYLPLVRK